MVSLNQELIFLRFIAAILLIWLTAELITIYQKKKRRKQTPDEYRTFSAIKRGIRGEA